MTTVALVYGTLLGFTVVVAWEQFSSAEVNVANEASTLATMYRQTVAMPVQEQREIRVLLRKYTTAVQGPEWRQQEQTRGRAPATRARSAITEMYRVIGRQDPDAVSSAINSEFLGQLTVLASERNTRVLDAEPRIPWLLWCGLVFGGALLVGLTGFMRLASTRGHIVLSGAVACCWVCCCSWSTASTIRSDLRSESRLPRSSTRSGCSTGSTRGTEHRLRRRRPKSLLRAEEGLPRGVAGAADPRFANVIRIFAGLFPGRRFGGGALVVYIDGKPVVDVWTGWSDRDGEAPWTANTGAMVFSATKGVAATVVHRLVDRGLLDYDTPVAEYWPEFGANGKSDITVRDVLRHRSGLSHLKGVTKEDLLDHHLMEERLAAAPVDHLRGLPAYHALTYGWLVSGVCRAVTGMGMRELIRDEVARPLNTDGVHLGRPPAGSPTKVAQILLPQKRGPIRCSTSSHRGWRACRSPARSARCTSPASDPLCRAIFRSSTGRFPAANGVVTGRGLAKMYAAFANGGVIDGEAVPLA